MDYSATDLRRMAETERRRMAAKRPMIGAGANMACDDCGASYYSAAAASKGSEPCERCGGTVTTR